jgi:hypothetical protein
MRWRFCGDSIAGNELVRCVSKKVAADATQYNNQLQGQPTFSSFSLEACRPPKATSDNSSYKRMLGHLPILQLANVTTDC